MIRGDAVSATVAAGFAISLMAGTDLQAQTAERAREPSGRALYDASCAACHAHDGTGAPRSVVGFDTPIPDFSDCSFATPEADADWLAVAHQGGPVRAFDRRMPAFGEALTNDELSRILQYIRGFCGDARWPRGELNLPRALVTEKAFPENEAVYTATVTGNGFGSEFLYERRLGARSQYEIAVPVETRESPAGGWSRGLGDVAFAVKHVLFHSLDSGRILSAAGELILPTGKEERGLGSGTAIVEPFVAFGQILPSETFLQLQAGFELPANRNRAVNEAFWRAAYGRTFMERNFGRTWTPMLEVLGARPLTENARLRWDVVPQLQVSLSRRQHILLNAGVQLPLNERSDRRTRVISYFLWDWFDGGLFEGWR